jgi:hypothetical protein
MPATNEKVMEMVRKELKANPDAENKDLYRKAEKLDASIGDLSLRQFHARYPLQVKRKRAAKKRSSKSTTRKKGGKRTSTKKRTGKAAKGEVDRQAIRSTLLQFARDVSAADGKAEMIDLLGNVDDYVEDVVGALDGGGS